jgi:hypothetical protein
MTSHVSAGFPRVNVLDAYVGQVLLMVTEDRFDEEGEKDIAKRMSCSIAAGMTG